MNIEVLIDGITTVALDLIKNTDKDELITLSQACASYDINDRYAIFMDFEPFEYPHYGLWFAFYEKNAEDDLNIEEQDTADLTENSIRDNLRILFDSGEVKDCLMRDNNQTAI